MRHTAILIMAVSATLASLWYARPANCQQVCLEPAQAPCPEDSCRFGEQRAGFPFPMVQDQAGSSPTNGWGTVGFEDYLNPNLLGFLGNVLFYSAIFWLLRSIHDATRGAAQPAARFAIVPLLVIVLVGLAGGFLNYQTPRWTPPTSDQANIAILGTWQATNGTSGPESVFRFYADGRISITFPGFSGEPGQYTWLDDHTIRLTFGQNITYTKDEGGLCPQGLSLFTGLCHTKIVNPAAYPTPKATTAETTTQPDSGAYPEPLPPSSEQVYNMINDIFTVAVDRDTLTLTHASGTMQTLHRVTSG